jgi:hypothetical protein
MCLGWLRRRSQRRYGSCDQHDLAHPVAPDRLQWRAILGLRRLPGELSAVATIQSRARQGAGHTPVRP